MKILSIPIFLASSFALAQEKQNSESVAELEALSIESSPLGTKTTDVTQAWSVLSGDDLEKAKGATIAETLSATPGVSQTHFGPNRKPTDYSRNGQVPGSRFYKTEPILLMYLPSQKIMLFRLIL